ncbi:hypothetical protein [Flavobacterium agrisoli]|uniref:Uncharacterized protein n=1 Tax=Flavobacterium agrisoli TaxID=2793066 RepID=A0A934UHY1_9FLAO|nr:hypothetical protein [Flavobacterium agrisoli]MBK0368266.1 hypothetical protein [Flavobacterium agrisoli]
MNLTYFITHNTTVSDTGTNVIIENIENTLLKGDLKGMARTKKWYHGVLKNDIFL